MRGGVERKGGSSRDKEGGAKGEEGFPADIYLFSHSTIRLSRQLSIIEKSHGAIMAKNDA